jgi:hypothetical protein
MGGSGKREKPVLNISTSSYVFLFRIRQGVDEAIIVTTLGKILDLCFIKTPLVLFTFNSSCESLGFSLRHVAEGERCGGWNKRWRSEENKALGVLAFCR